MPRGTKQHASAATRADVVVPAKKQGTSKSVAQTRPLSSAAKSRTTPRLKPLDPSAVFESKRAKMPVAIEPELATLVAEAPSGQEWLHEIKFDGYRLLCHVADGKARLFTRRQLDWTARFPTIAGAAAKLPVGSAIFDGEAVVLEYDGTSSFQALQMALSEKSYERMAYYAFDLLYLDGYDLRPAPLTARKELLAKIWSGQKSDAGCAIAIISMATVGVSAGVLPAWLGGDHQQAARSSVSGRTRHGLAEGQVPTARGVRDRWLYRSGPARAAALARC